MSSISVELRSVHHSLFGVIFIMSSNITNESTWDPMKEDYFDPNFNSYSQGPGSRLDRILQPCFSRTHRETSLFKLHVKYIPSGLTENGIKNVFLHFGNPVEIYRQPSDCGPGWAFVSYATHAEAELTIRKLNNMPPFFFRVQFARSAEEKERIRREKKKDELLQTVLEGESYPIQNESSPFNSFSRGIGRGRAFPFPKQMRTDIQPGKFGLLCGGFNYNKVSCSSSPISEQYHKGNRIVMQAVESAADTMMKRVSMGRGYCPVNVSKFGSEVMYGRVNNGMYEFGIKQNVSELTGNCSYCNKLSVNHCQRCRAWYCSRECQECDWSFHRSNCISFTEENSQPKLPLDERLPIKIIKEEEIVEKKLPKSAVLNLKPGVKGSCQLQRTFTNGDMIASIVYPELKEEFSTLFHTLLSMKDSCETVQYKANVGETVAAKVESEDTWMRAHILAIDDLCYCVNLCDVGLVTTVRKVANLPDNLASLPEFAVRCSIVDVNSNIDDWCKDQSKFSFTVLSVDQARMSATCSLHTDTGQVIATFMPWIVEDILQTFSFENNDIVTLAAFIDHKSLFICPASEYGREMFSKLQQDVGFHCITTPCMTEMPLKDDIVACQFIPDGNYYRARVLGVEQQTVNVVYIDFGNEDYASITRLKPLREDLKKIVAMSLKVSLKNTENKPMTVSSCSLLTCLVGEETEMTLVLSESFKTGVELILPGGENLNDKINECLNPESVDISPEKKIKEHTIFTEDHLQYSELPLDKIIDFVVLHKLDSVTFIGYDANGGEVVDYIYDSMLINVNKYCNSLSETSYVPRIGELCFARFEDGMWYRAMYISDGVIRENNIWFFDFGNMTFIDKTNIRKMTLEYVETPVVALYCMLKDLPSSITTDAQKNCVEELVHINSTYKAHVISNNGPGIYVIEFPHVSETLCRSDFSTE